MDVRKDKGKEEREGRKDGEKNRCIKAMEKGMIEIRMNGHKEERLDGRKEVWMAGWKEE